jgi:hypothetical protein
MRTPHSFSVLSGLIGCTWLATAAMACGSPAQPANGANDVGDAGVAMTEPAPKWDSTSSAAAATSPGTPVTNSTTPGAHRTDVYDKEATETELRRAALQVKRNCGEAKNTDGKAVGPWGKTQVQVTLGHNGHVRGVTIADPFNGAPSGNCVLQAFGLLSFPPWDGPDTTIPWDVELVQPSK